MARTPRAALNATDKLHPDDNAIEQSSAPSRRRKWQMAWAGAAAIGLLAAGLWWLGLSAMFFGSSRQSVVAGPVYVKIPEIIANLNVPAGQDSYVKLKATLELANKKSARAAVADMPRVIDVFETYLRAMRPDELRGASGTYRLREALIDRIRVAAAPADVKDVLFQELIVQ